jgi:hypothetical protein
LNLLVVMVLLMVFLFDNEIQSLIHLIENPYDTD